MKIKSSDDYNLEAQRYVLRVYFGDDPLTEPGNYRVVLPAGLLVTSNDGDVRYTGAITFNFSIVYSDAYTCIPAAGDVSLASLNVATISYSDVSAIKLNENADEIQLIENKVAENTKTVVGTYSPSVTGSDVKLKLNLTGELTYGQKTSSLYYTINVPANSWTLTSANGDNPNPTIVMGEYALVPISASDFSFDSPVLAEDLSELKLHVAQPVNVLATANSLFALRMGTNAVLNYRFKSISDDAREITLTIANTGTCNANPELVLSGDYTVQIPSNSFSVADGSSNSYYDIPITVINNNPKLEAWRSTSPGNLNAGVFTITNCAFAYPYPVVVADASAKIALKKNGVILATKTANDTSTSNAKNGKGSTSITMPMLVAPFGASDPGVYTLEIPKGAFKYGDVYNDAQTLTWYIADRSISVSASPELATVNPDLDINMIEEVTVTYPEDYIVSVNSADKSVAGGYLGISTYNNYLAGKSNSLSLNNRVEVKAVKVVDGNKVTFKLEHPVYGVNGETYYFGLEIPAGTLWLEKDGVKLPNPQQFLPYNAKTAPTGEFLINGEPLDPSRVYTLAELGFNSNGGENAIALSSTNDDATPAISYLGKVDIYMTAQPSDEAIIIPKPIIKDANGNTVATLTMSQTPGNSKSVTLSPSESSFPDLTSETKTYTIVLGENAMQYNSKTAMTASNNTVLSAPISATIQIGDVNTSVDSVASVATTVYTVYSIDGRLILNKAPYSQLASLQNGLYIINGKKILIRK